MLMRGCKGPRSGGILQPVALRSPIAIDQGVSKRIVAVAITTPHISQDFCSRSSPRKNSRRAFAPALWALCLDLCLPLRSRTGKGWSLR
jgi:hypothetical protein